MGMIIIFMTFYVKHCWFFNVLFTGLKKPFSFKLSMMYSNLIKYTFVNRIETFHFSPYLIPPELGNLLSVLIFMAI